MWLSDFVLQRNLVFFISSFHLVDIVVEWCWFRVGTWLLVRKVSGVGQWYGRDEQHWLSLLGLVNHTFSGSVGLEPSCTTWFINWLSYINLLFGSGFFFGKLGPCLLLFFQVLAGSIPLVLL